MCHCQPKVSAVIFDLDGTLTEPCLDFDLIRREIGLPTEPRTPILEALERMAPSRRARAEAILQRHEESAALASELRESAGEVVRLIRGHGIPVGILTRNSRHCTEIVLRRHGLEFDHVHTREDGNHKPSPQAVLAMCRRWAVSPSKTWVIGDYLFDLQAGRAAGATAVLIIGDGPEPEYSREAHHVIRRLRDLLPLIGLVS